MADTEFMVINAGTMEDIAEKMRFYAPRGWSLTGTAGVNLPGSGTGLLYSAIIERPTEVRDSLSPEALEEERRFMAEM